MNHSTEGLNDRSWKLRTFGPFLLTNPDGQVVRLPDIKVEALLVILVANRKNGIDRRILTDILWPGQYPASLVNLRQAIYRLRRAIGSHFVESSFSHCGLSPEFIVSSDLEDLAGQSGRFMPRQEGEWFEDMRRQMAGEQESDTERVMESYLNLLYWYRDSDVDKMLRLMANDLHMTYQVPVAQLRPLLATIPDSSPNLGWKFYLLGQIEDRSGSSVDSMNHYRNAMRFARSSGDRDLSREAVASLCNNYIVQNRLELAMRLANYLGSTSPKDRTWVSRGTICQGLVMLHAGERDKGFALLRKGERLIEDESTLTERRLVRTYLHATFDDTAAGEDLLAKADDFLDRNPTPRLSIYRDLARLSVELNRRVTSETYADAVKFVQTCENWGFRQLAVYGKEIAGGISSRIGDEQRAAKDFDCSARIRRSIGMQYTAWDRMRLVRTRS